MKKSTITQVFNRHAIWVFFLLAISFAGYGMFLKYVPIYDFYNFFFPYRYSVVDTIHHHLLPFWNPYQTMGIPEHADPQSGVFYLPVWFFALIFGKYTTICCAFEFIFHAFFGALGCYLLAYHFTKDKAASFVVGCCYMLSGFFVGNAQHLVWIISATWLPWVVCSFIKLFDSPSITPALLLPLSFSLMLTGGYPGFVFALLYFLLAIFIFYFIKIIFFDRTSIKKTLIFCSSSLILTLLLSAPTVISFFEIQHEITRGTALAFEDTGLPVTLQSLISFFFPYIACSESGFVNTDISMGSIFIGLLTLPMVVIGLVKNRNKLIWLLFSLGILYLFMSFGQGLPANRLIFEHVPFLGLIRLPSLHRIFFILTILIVAVIGLHHFIEDPDKYRMPLGIFGTSVCILFIIIAFAAARSHSTFNAQAPWDGPFAQKIMLESIISAVTSGIFTLSICFLQNKHLTISLFALMVLEPVCQANICGPKTIYATHVDKDCLARATSTEGFPIPDSLMSDVKIVHQRDLLCLWTNVGMFTKDVEWYSISPIKLYRHQQMLAPYHTAAKPLFLPISFYPREVVYDTVGHFLKTDTAYTTNPALVHSYDEEGDYSTISCFAPGHVTVHTLTHQRRPWVLCQNVYPGWQVTIDGKKAKLDTLNFTMQTVYVPAGKHTIELNYRRPLIAWAFLLQAILSTVAFIVLICVTRSSCRTSPTVS